MDWLLNNWEPILALTTIVGGWFGLDKAKQAKLADFRTCAKQVLANLESNPSAVLQDGRQLTEKFAWDALEGLEVKKTSDRELILDALLDAMFDRIQTVMLHDALKELSDKASLIDVNKKTGANIPMLGLPMEEMGKIDPDDPIGADEKTPKLNIQVDETNRTTTLRLKTDKKPKLPKP